MKYLPSIQTMIYNAKIASLMVVAMILCSTASSEVYNYKRIGEDSNGKWEDNCKWDPVPDFFIGGNWIAHWEPGNNTRTDSVTIDGAIVSSPYKYVAFKIPYNATEQAGKNGTYTALTLTDDATLELGAFQISSASSNGAEFVRNADIQSGSSLSVIELTTGAQNNTQNCSTWNIAGTVQAGSFQGLLGYHNSNGGYILNVAGGSLDVTNSFDWFSNDSSETSYANTSEEAIAHINLSNRGSLTVGTMEGNWTHSDEAYINFMDTSSSATFGKANFVSAGDIEQLISEGHIRVDGDSVAASDIKIVDNGSTWTISASQDTMVNHFTWVGPETGGNWSDESSWYPVPELPLVTGSADTWIGGWRSENSTKLDTVTIDGATINSSKNLDFRVHGAAAANKDGTYTSLTLTNNASLTVADLQITTCRIDGIDYIRNADIQAGSSLNVDELMTGSSNWTPATSSSTWNIEGSVQAATFKGQFGTYYIVPAMQVAGGYILNINGGSLTVSGDFDWNYNDSPAHHTPSPMAIGRINISNGGTFSAGTIDTNLGFSSESYLNFADGTGSATFGVTEDLDTAQDIASLIIQGHIRINGSPNTPLNQFDIDLDNTEQTWTISPASE